MTFDCQTADDVRKLAYAVHRRRQEAIRKAYKPPPRLKAVLEPETPKQPPAPKPVAAFYPPRLRDVSGRFVPEARPEAFVPVTVNQIIEATCKAFDVRREDLLSPRRYRAVVKLRYAIMYLAKVRTVKSYPQIGRELNRDHTTVVHGVWKVEESLKSNPLWIKPVLMHIESLLPGSMPVPEGVNFGDAYSW